MIQLRKGDLAAADAEAILRPCGEAGDSVNAAGRRLEARAGEAVARRLEEQGDLPLGTAVLTPAGELACDFLVHVAVRSREEPPTLATVERGLVNALRRAADFGIGSLALPPLGMGVGTLDAGDAARVMAEVLRNHLGEGRPPSTLTVVVDSDYEESVLAAAFAAVGITPEPASE